MSFMTPVLQTSAAGLRAGWLLPPLLTLTVLAPWLWIRFAEVVQPSVILYIIDDSHMAALPL